MNWQTIVVLVLLSISALTSLSLAIFVWRREMPGAKAFAWMTISLAAWSVAYALEVGAQSHAPIVLASKLQYVGITFVPVGWFIFAMVFSGREGWWSRPRIVGLSIIPALTIVLAFTNELHGLHWATTGLSTDGPFIMMDAVYGIGWWSYFIYAYILMFIGSVVLVRSLWNFPAAYRWQFVLLILSPILPWLSNALYIARISPVPQLDLAPFAFTISTLILGVGIFRFRLFDIVPVARSTVVDNINIAIFVLDQQNRIVDTNPAAGHLLAQPAANLIGKPVVQVLSPWSDVVARFIDMPAAREEIQVQTGDLRRYFSIRISPIYNHAHRLTGRLVMLNDITSDKLAEEAVAMAQVRTEFLAKVGHELRTPLNGIMGLVEMLEYGVYGPITEKQSEALQQIIDRTQFLTRLMNDLLELTHLESGRFSLVIEKFRPANLFDQIRETFGGIAERKGLAFSMEISPDVPETLHGDSTRLYQILVNLVDNAIKFTQEGKIDLRAYCIDATHWAVEVADTGIGIPQHNQAHLFNAFQQINYSVTREHDGVGLGLSIVKQLANLMGGDVKLVSEETKGAVFTVILPLD